MTTRCIDGRLLRHDPQPDDPSLETDIGQCPECDGEGCDATDLVSRLRALANSEHDDLSVADEAADEIERLRRIERASKQVLSGLDQRIAAAPMEAKPVFHGIVELHDAIFARSDEQAAHEASMLPQNQ